MYYICIKLVDRNKNAESLLCCGVQEQDRTADTEIMPLNSE